MTVMRGRRLSDEEVVERAIYAAFGSRHPHSLRVALEKGLVPRQYQQEAKAILASYEYPRQASWALPARSLYNDPGWDNVIRALEEDR